MPYRYSQIDHKNMEWMAKDISCSTLSGIRLIDGHLRGLYPFSIKFRYPITAIAGHNGSGKSTLLAMASCAFHNSKERKITHDNEKKYYTFKDFFIQNRDETPPQGIGIEYDIIYNDWYGSPPGEGTQLQQKKKGGKWTNYDRRCEREVLYFGVNRVVPHFERSVYRSYSRNFKDAKLDVKDLSKVKDVASTVMGKRYDDFKIYQHSKYRLPVVSCGGNKYSGFNMGAGEASVFEILTAIVVYGRGVMIVVDEIELGLHDSAQKRFIAVLKELCHEYHCQIICSTHSGTILEAMPPESRFFIESIGSYTSILHGITSEYAKGLLREGPSKELSIFVEDDVAATILATVLPCSVKRRASIHVIGSSELVLRQMASRYVEKNTSVVALLDGDKRNVHTRSIAKIKDYTEASTEKERDDVSAWADSSVKYLPGTRWPERVLFSKVLELIASENNTDYISQAWGVEAARDVSKIVDGALVAGKHNEIWHASTQVGISREVLICSVVRYIMKADPEFFREVISGVESALPR